MSDIDKEKEQSQINPEDEQHLSGSGEVPILPESEAGELAKPEETEAEAPDEPVNLEQAEEAVEASYQNDAAESSAETLPPPLTDDEKAERKAQLLAEADNTQADAEKMYEKWEHGPNYDPTSSKLAKLANWMQYRPTRNLNENYSSITTKYRSRLSKAEQLRQEAANL
ncbi:hypothetical protein FWF48_02720 [Candidatus Saccharibacteria bacterium]|nr:hypothetical protein [Candidatus Saccharibacteria bacterium]